MHFSFWLTNPRLPKAKVGMRVGILLSFFFEDIITHVYGLLVGENAETIVAMINYVQNVAEKFSRAEPQFDKSRSGI